MKKYDELLIAAEQNIEGKKYWLSKLSGDLQKNHIFPNTTKINKNPVISKITFGIDEPVTSVLTRLSNQADEVLYMILLAGIAILINKYTANPDIIIGAPIFQQDKQAEFINTIVPIRTLIKDDMSVKDILLQLRQTVIEADENQNYPIEILLDQLNMPGLFTISIVVENVHNREDLYLPQDILFNFKRIENNIEGIIEYNPILYKREFIKQMVIHFKNVLNYFIDNLEISLKDIEILTPIEKEKLLYNFNNESPGLPIGIRLDKLFEEQVEKKADNIASVFEDQVLTYKKINEKANGIAGMLKEKNIKPGTIVGILFDGSPGMIYSILGILKLGCAYLPLDPEYPHERIEYMLKDCKVEILLTDKHLMEKVEPITLNSPLIKQCVDSQDIDAANISTFKPGNAACDNAYVIYTSGTTGNPKAVPIKHEGVVNYTLWRIKSYRYNETDITLQLLSYSFDGFVSNFYSSLMSGGKLILLPGIKKLDINHIVKTIENEKVTNLSLVPGLFENILAHAEKVSVSTIRFIVFGGEPTRSNLVYRIKDKIPGAIVINEYGPTEATVTACANIHITGDDTSIIGKPIDNTQVYIVDNRLNPLPVYIPGEICISGFGVSGGYLNNPTITAEKFVQNPFKKNEKLYKTGDLARWLPDGNIEFLGRSDRQVKVNGFRIEPGELETRLLDIENIKKAVVIDRVNNQGEKYLCAYIVCKKEVDIPAVRTRLSEQLPYFMVPSYFEIIEEIPLTTNGKIDKKALPEPEVNEIERYVAPGNEIEKKLVEIWSKVLNVSEEVIGIDSNFFRLGGHSLKAVLSIAEIQKELAVKLPLTEFFKNPTVRQLSQFIEKSPRQSSKNILCVEKKEYYQVSSAQQGLYILQQMDLESTRYNTPQLVALNKGLDKKMLTGIFKKLVSRHESLRTSFLVINRALVQRIQDEADFDMEYFDESSKTGKEGGSYCLGRPFDLAKAPLIRVGLVRRCGEADLLLIDQHHIISDFISQNILQREFISILAGNSLPGQRLQYKDYSQWHNTKEQQGVIKAQEEYWLKEFEEEAPVLNLPYDYDRSWLCSFEGAALNFFLNEEETNGLIKISGDHRVTLFVTLLSVFTILLSKLSGQRDLIIGVPVTGRSHPDFQEIIGMFVNTLAIRIYPQGEKKFADFLQDVKLKVLSGFENQDYPFNDLVEKIVTKREAWQNPLFDVVIDFHKKESISKERSRELIAAYSLNSNQKENRKKTAKFELTLDILELKDYLYCSFEYCSELFKKETIQKFITLFKKIVDIILKKPGVKIVEIETIIREKKREIIKTNREDNVFNENKKLDEAIAADFDW